MEKYKFLFIMCLGIFTLFYNIFDNYFLDLFKQTDIAVLLKGQINTETYDSYIGTIFDYLLSFLFNINIKDMESYMRMFGG